MIEKYGEGNTPTPLFVTINLEPRFVLFSFLIILAGKASSSLLHLQK